MGDSIRVLLADDHSLVRSGFRRMLEDEPDFEIVGEAADGLEAVRLAAQLKPQVIVMDFTMPGLDGATATRQIRANDPSVAVLMLSMHSGENYVRNALDAGATGYLLKDAVDVDLPEAIRTIARGEKYLSQSLTQSSFEEDDTLAKITPREKQVLQLIAQGKSNKEIGGILNVSANTVAVHRANLMDALGIHKAAELVLYAVRKGLVTPPLMDRRHFLLGSLAAAQSFAQNNPAFRLTDVTTAAGLHFRHNSGAYGKKFLPETLGAGCAFIDYDNDGWQDILLVNGMDWAAHHTHHSTLALYHNNRNGTFTDVTHAAGLYVEMYGLGVAVADYNNDGYPDIYLTGFGQNRLFRNTGKGTFIDATQSSGLGGRQALSTSAMWFDFDRDGLLDLFVCNYVKWTPGVDVYCSMDGRQKSYCTPEAYHGATCWLFRNRGNGTFEDVTAQSGLFDNSSKSLGVAMFDYDNDGWPDLFVANDTQPNKLYRNLRNGKFEEVAVHAGVAFSEDGKARAGMGVDAADIDNSGRITLAVTNFDNEMLALYRLSRGGVFQDEAAKSGLGALTRGSLGFGCCFFDADLDGRLDLVVANGHIDDTVRNLGGKHYAQSPQLFLQSADGKFRDVAAEAGGGFVNAKVGRGIACGDFDNDGDVDILLTTNNGPAYLYRNDQAGGNKSIRFRLTGTQSNRDGIGAIVKIEANGITQTRMVRSGSSYLSQSELPVTFGLAKQDRISRAVIQWPSGRAEEFRNLNAGRTWKCIEGKGIS